MYDNYLSPVRSNVVRALDALVNVNPSLLDLSSGLLDS